MTDNWKGLVVTIKADLELRGQQWKTNCDAFQITGRVAWALRHHGAKLFSKHAPQNGCYIQVGGQTVGVSHDAIAFPDGWVDCLVGAGPPQNENRPAWTWHANVPSAGELADPFDLDAGVVILPPLTPPVPAPIAYVPPADWSTARFRSLEWYAEAAHVLEDIYRGVLGRPADFGGAGNWLWHAVEGEQSPAWVVARFKESPEYAARHLL